MISSVWCYVVLCATEMQCEIALCVCHVVQCDVVWLWLLISALVYMLFWFYYWLLAENSRDTINWYGLAVNLRLVCTSISKRLV